VSDRALLAEAISIVQAHGDHPEVVACLRSLAHAATQLVIRRTGTDTWLVGQSKHPTPFTPRGAGLLPLALLLAQPGLHFDAAVLAGEPCTARALKKRLLRTVDELCQIEGAFAFLRVAIGVSDKTALVFRDLHRYPRVVIEGL